MAQRKLFGTDGIRGHAGADVGAELALALGRAVTARAQSSRPQVLIVRDTRESGPMLAAALAAGVSAAGGDALDAGVLPTPAASILVRRHGLDVAAVVSASHNPYADNGIKFFGPDGMKLPDEAEAEIERALELEPPPPPSFGRVRGLEGALDDYLRELRSAFPLDLTGKRVVVDCANGATYRAAPAALEALGADVDAIFCEPDGRNINDGCGSTHTDALSERVRRTGADLGFAFDGDGDRVLAVDRNGRLCDGDELIALCALHLREQGRLGGGVAVTVMANHGFAEAMTEAGIEIVRAKVGDRYVLEELRRRDWSFGGEQSGHVINLAYAPTGDGLGTALLVLEALGGRDLAEVEPFRRLPQTLVNVRVADRDAAARAPGVRAAVEEAEAELAGRGRVLIRPSGTEPVVRVMVEAPTEDEAEALTGRLVGIVERALGA